MEKINVVAQWSKAAFDLVKEKQGVYVLRSVDSAGCPHVTYSPNANPAILFQYAYDRKKRYDFVKENGTIEAIENKYTVDELKESVDNFFDADYLNDEHVKQYAKLMVNAAENGTYIANFFRQKTTQNVNGELIETTSAVMKPFVKEKRVFRNPEGALFNDLVVEATTDGEIVRYISGSKELYNELKEQTAIADDRSAHLLADGVESITDDTDVEVKQTIHLTI